jgi:hypothetical protein
MDGFWSFANRRLMTIFSAPAYCNVFKNAAGVMKIDENLHCQLVAFVPDGVRFNLGEMSLITTFPAKC